MKDLVYAAFVAKQGSGRQFPSGRLRCFGAVALGVVGATSCNELTRSLVNEVNLGGSKSSSTQAPMEPMDSIDPPSHHGATDVCLDGYQPHPSDMDVVVGFATYEENEQLDATLQPEMIAWMEERYWQEAHYQWHQVRRCVDSAFPSDPGVVDICEYPELRPEANECENGQDGYEFLAMHRHMLETLRQLWPSHASVFSGWDQFPSREDYPEIVQEYFREWGPDVLEAAAIADNIEDNLDLFADEGEFAMWIQCGSLGGFVPSSLHGALHFNGAPFENQSHNVSNGRRNLDSYIFWQLHGWIDKIWERYRVATGRPYDEPELQAEMVSQCREMHSLADIVASVGNSSAPEPEPETTDMEAGVFHQVVRPALESFGCSLCHGAGETAGLRLGFEVSSTEIVQRLVNRPAANAIGYSLVVPGDPDNSWLYLKATGQSEDSGVQCQGSMNCAQSMPPGGGRLPEEALEALRQWIEDGAEAPSLQ